MNCTCHVCFEASMKSFCKMANIHMVMMIILWWRNIWGDSGVKRSMELEGKIGMWAEPTWRFADDLLRSSDFFPKLKRSPHRLYLECDSYSSRPLFWGEPDQICPLGLEDQAQWGLLKACRSPWPILAAPYQPYSLSPTSSPTTSTPVFSALGCFLAARGMPGPSNSRISEIPKSTIKGSSCSNVS